MTLLAPTADAGTLIPEDLARRNGMERAWFAQAQLNPARHHVESATLEGDMLVVLTTAGVVHAMDANTGGTLWTTRIGNPGYPSLGPAISAEHVAIVNGSTLFVLDRKKGRELFARRVGGAPGGGPALTATHAFVPLFSGRVEGFAITDGSQAPWYYTSRGRIFQQVAGGENSVVWSTDASRLYVAAGDTDGIRYRFDTGAPIVAPATVRAPLVYAASTSGYVYAIHEDNGQQQWRYAAGFGVRHSPMVVGNLCFVATDEPALHAIDAETGLPKWVAPGVSQFVAASQNRVYGLSNLGGLVALGLESGVVEARAASRGLNTAVLNNQTDRLYIFSDDGLVQCFHEIGADKPFYHQRQPGQETEKGTGDQGDKPAQPEESGAQDPFGGGDPFGGNDPFGGGAPAGNDPFGGGTPAESDPEESDPADPFGGGAPAGDDPFGGAPAGNEDDPFGGGDDDPFGSL